MGTAPTRHAHSCCMARRAIYSSPCCTGHSLHIYYEIAKKMAYHSSICLSGPDAFYFYFSTRGRVVVAQSGFPKPICHFKFSSIQLIKTMHFGCCIETRKRSLTLTLKRKMQCLFVGFRFSLPCTSTWIIPSKYHSPKERSENSGQRTCMYISEGRPRKESLGYCNVRKRNIITLCAHC